MRIQNYSSVLPPSFRDAERAISAPQLGHVITPLCGGSKSSETDTPKAVAILSTRSRDVFPFVARLNVTSDVPILAANSFWVMLFFKHNSLIRNLISFNVNLFTATKITIN